MAVTLTVKGFEPIEAEFKRLSALDFTKVCKDNMRQVYDRGQSNTPHRTGYLRLSMQHVGEVVGYGAEYAPHVEYGHRTRGGKGYVPGQRFLKENVDEQREIFYEDLRKALNGR